MPIGYKLEPLPRDIKEIIKWEDLDPGWFHHQARGLHMELGQKYSDIGYSMEKLNKLVELAVLVCRAKEGRGNIPGIRSCLKKTLPRLEEFIE